MKRLRAILRCLYHAAEPPVVERWCTGSCHYQDGGGAKWTYMEHAATNLGQAFRLLAFLPVDGEFHGL